MTLERLKSTVRLYMHVNLRASDLLYAREKNYSNSQNYNLAIKRHRFKQIQMLSALTLI